MTLRTPPTIIELRYRHAELMQRKAPEWRAVMLALVQVQAAAMAEIMRVHGEATFMTDKEPHA